MSIKIKAYRGTSASTPTLDLAEFGFETDTDKLFIGNGVDNSFIFTMTSTPAADRIAFWDNSASNLEWLSLGTGLSISGTSLEMDSTILKESDVDNTPVNGVTTDPISSNWAYDHAADVDAHHAKYTDSEARSAAVNNSISDGNTTTAPSEDAVHAALANKSDTTHNHSGTYEPVISPKNSAFNDNYGTTAGTVCEGNDSRLSDARTPTSHDNTYHSATYITSSGVTYEALNGNSDVGTGASQVAAGNHNHSGVYEPVLTFGISNDNAVKIDDLDVVSGDYAKFTANGLQGRSASEVLSDLSLDSELQNLSTAEVNYLEAIYATGVTSTEFDYLDGVTSSIQEQLNAKGTMSDLSDDSTPELDGDLFLTDYCIELNDSPRSDHSASGNIISLTNGASGSMAFGDVAYVASDGDLEFADADSALYMPGMYMAIETISAATSGKFLRSGIARDDTWNWTPGGLVYVSTSGGSGGTLTQTKPSGSGDQVQIVGQALSADIIDFKPNTMLIEIS